MSLQLSSIGLGSSHFEFYSVLIAGLLLSPIGLAMSKPCKLLIFWAAFGTSHVSHQSSFDPMAVRTTRTLGLLGM